MTKPNKIDEILNITQEEAAEIIQVISKIKRFGIGATYLRAGDHLSNVDALNTEVGDLLLMIDLLQLHGILDPEKLEQAKRIKIEKLKKWSSIYDEQ